MIGSIPKSRNCVFHVASKNPQAGCIEGSTSYACIHRFPDYIPNTPELYDCADGCKFFLTERMQLWAEIIERAKAKGETKETLEFLQAHYEDAREDSFNDPSSLKKLKEAFCDYFTD